MLAGGQREETPAAFPARVNEEPGGGQTSARGEEAPRNPAAEGRARARAPAACPTGEERGQRSGGSERSPSQEEGSDRSSPSPGVHPGDGVSKAQSEEVGLEAGILEYVRIVVSLIEARRVMREEVLEMLRRTRRQHSLVRERRIHYVVRSLDEDPP